METAEHQPAHEDHLDANREAWRRYDACRDRVAVLSARLHAIGAELVEALAELDTIELPGGARGWEATGCRSIARWLSNEGGFTPADARHIAAAVPALTAVPDLVAEAHEGRVSLGMLAAASRVVAENPDTDRDVVAEVVHTATPAQALRVFANYADMRKSLASPNAYDPPTSTHWWRTWTDHLGRGRIDAALDPLAAELIERAWDAARAVHERERDTGDDDAPQPPKQPSADDVATTLASVVLDNVDSAGLRTSGGDHFRVQVHVDLATLAELQGRPLDGRPVRLGTECFSADSGRRLSAAELEHAMCGAGVQTVIEHKGVPLWMGNEVRSATHHQRRALRMRSGGSGGCEFPGCTNTRFVDVHHVQHHADGGSTDPSNLVVLCGWHHRQLHREGWRITTDGDQQFTFWNGDVCLGSTTIARDPRRRPKHRRRKAPPPTPLFDPATEQKLACLGPDATHSPGVRDPLTRWGIDVYLQHLIAA